MAFNPSAAQYQGMSKGHQKMCRASRENCDFFAELAWIEWVWSAICHIRIPIIDIVWVNDRLIR
jgi:hypothetical protein